MVVQGVGLLGSEAFVQAPWLQVASVRDRLQVDYLRVELDLGEAEALVLAQESKARQFLVDEERARTVARLLHIPHIGTAGILVLAKQFGYIPRVAPLIAQLRSHKFYLSNQLVKMILCQVGE